MQMMSERPKDKDDQTEPKLLDLNQGNYSLVAGNMVIITNKIDGWNPSMFTLHVI